MPRPKQAVNEKMHYSIADGTDAHQQRFLWESYWEAVGPIVTDLV